MTDKKISELTAASALAGTEEIPVVQSAATVKSTPAAIRTYMLGQANTWTAAQTLASGTTLGWNSDTFIGRRAAAGLMFGAADAASPVAQTLSFQGARGGTDSNVAAVTATIQGSLGTGTGAAGLVSFKAGYAAASGTTQHSSNQCFSVGTWPGISASYGAVWLGAATPTSSNMALMGTGADTRINSSGSIDFFNSASTFVFRVNAGAIINSASNVFGWESGTSASNTNDTGLYRNAAGVVEINNGTAGTYRDLKLRNLLASGGNGSYVQTPSMTVANLAAAATAGAGARAFVTDATATTYLSTVAGGGSNKVPVVSDGTNWLIG